jgi:hypothetical protein
LQRFGNFVARKTVILLKVSMIVRRNNANATSIGVSSVFIYLSGSSSSRKLRRSTHRLAVGAIKHCHDAESHAK